MPSQLCYLGKSLIEGYLTPFIFCASIEHDYIRIFKVSVFQAMGNVTVGKAKSEHNSPRFAGSTPVRGNFLLNLFCCNKILADLPE